MQFVFLMKIPKRARQQMRKYLAYSSVALVVLLFLMMLKINILSVIIITVMIIIATFSKVYKQFTTMSIGFELVTPVVIILSFKVNIVFAIIAAIFMVIASDFISGNLVGHAVAVEVGVYVLLSIIAGIAGAIGVSSFASLGLALVILRNVVMWLIMVIPGFVDPFRGTLATLPNFFINGFIITTIGVSIVNML